MKNKKFDIPYCGCNIEKIRTANPTIDPEIFRYLYQWIVERYAIHLRKDVEHLPAPWTDDKILRKFRFTNVRREHDKETKWTIQNICSLTEQDMSWMSKMCNLILFRMFNKSETCKNFMPINFDEGVNWGQITQYFSTVPKSYNCFTNAFYASGLKGSCYRAIGYPSKHAAQLNGVTGELAVIRTVEQNIYQNTQLLQKLRGSHTAKEFFDALREIPGVHDFLAYQIFVDYTYCAESPWSENEFTVAGVGCQKGLSMLFTDYDGMTYEEALFWMRDNWDDLCQKYGIDWDPDKLFCDLPDYDRYMNVMSLENCMCELSKYVRAIYGIGRPRNMYIYDDGGQV